jgi:chromosome segregation ATPase
VTGGSLVAPFRLARVNGLAAVYTGLEVGDLRKSRFIVSRKKIEMAKSKLQEVQERLEQIQESSDSAWSNQQEIVGLLATVTQSLSDACQTRQSEYVAVVQRLSSIESDVMHIKNDITSLCKVVRDGNGQPSMAQRLASVEAIVANNSEDIEELKSHANTIIAAKALSKAQVVAGLIGMFVTALLSALALFATLG